MPPPFSPYDMVNSQFQHISIVRGKGRLTTKVHLTVHSLKFTMPASWLI